MASTTELSLKITADARQATKEVTGLSDAAQNLRVALEKAAAAGGNKALAPSIAAGAAEATKSLAAVSASVDALGATVGRMGHLGLFLAAFPAYTGMAVDAIKTVSGALQNASLEASRLQQTYAFAFNGIAAGAQNLSYVRDTAARLGVNLGEAARAYGKLAAASVGTALEGDKTRGIFEAVSKASLVMGLSAQETGGALLAISQMMSKGTVAAEELRGQLGERLPGAFQMAARAMGVSTAELGKMLEQGKVITDDFLPKFAREMERTLGDSAVRAADGLQASINRLDGAWQHFMQSLAGNEKGALAGAAGSLGKVLEDAAGQMEKLAKNGNGLLARLFIGLSVAEANVIGALFGVNPGTGAGLARGSDWMSAKLGEIERLKKAANPTSADYTVSASTDLRIAQEQYDEAVAARNARGIRLPGRAALADVAIASPQEAADSVAAAMKAKSDGVTEFILAATQKQRKALAELAQDYAKNYLAAAGDPARQAAVLKSYNEQRAEITKGPDNSFAQKKAEMDGLIAIEKASATVRLDALKDFQQQGLLSEHEYTLAVEAETLARLKNQYQAQEAEYKSAKKPEDRTKALTEMRLTAVEMARTQQTAEGDIAAAEAKRFTAWQAQSGAEQKGLDEQLAKGRLELEQIGMTADAKDRLTAKIRDEAAAAAKANAQIFDAAAQWASGANDQAAADFYQQAAAAAKKQAETLRQISSVENQQAAKRVAVKAAEDSAQAWKKFSDDIEKSLTDALMRSFEAGNGFGKTFIQTLKHALETAALKIVVQAIVSPVMGAVGSALGIAGAAGSTGNLLSGASGLSNLSGGGLYNSFATSSLGGSLGLSQVAAIQPMLEVPGIAAAADLTTLGTALPWIGGALALGSAFGLFGGDSGDTQRSGQYVSPFAQSDAIGAGPYGANADGSRYNWANNHWFSADMAPAQDSFDAQLQASEKSIIDKLALSAAQIAAVDAQVSTLDSKVYGFGMEHTDVSQSGAFEAITADRMQAIATGLGMSLKDLQDQMSGAAKTAKELAAEAEALAAAARTASLSGGLKAMQETLKALDSVQSLRDTLGQSISQVRGTWTYDAQMADLRGRLTGADDLATQVALAGNIKDLVLSRYQSESSAIQDTKAKALEAQAALRAALGQVGDYARGLLLSDVSPLTNAQRLAEASAQYNALRAPAGAGDTGALGKLSGAADAYLKEARSFYASGSDYAAIFNTVQGGLSALGLTAGAVTDTGDWQAQLLKVQDDAVTQLNSLVGATDEWTSTLETNLAQQITALTALNLTQEEIAANTKDLDRRIGVLINAAIGLSFDKLAAAIEKSDARTVKALQAAVESVRLDG